jgi:hypothetical protein
MRWNGSIDPAPQASNVGSWETVIKGDHLMEKVATVGLDLAKSIFQIHAVNDSGDVLVRRALRRSQVLDFFHRLPVCRIGIEACASAHHWAREIAAFGHLNSGGKVYH